MLNTLKTKCFFSIEWFKYKLCFHICFIQQRVFPTRFFHFWRVLWWVLLIYRLYSACTVNCAGLVETVSYSNPGCSFKSLFKALKLSRSYSLGKFQIRGYDPTSLRSNILYKMLTLALKIYKMDVSVVATTFFSLRMFIKTASRMLYE